MKKEKMSEHMFSNAHYVYKNMFKLRKRGLLYLIFNVISSLLIPLLSALVGSLAVYIIEGKLSGDIFTNYIIYMSIIAAITVVLQIINMYCNGLFQWECMYARCGSFWYGLCKVAVTTDYENVEPKSKREIINNGFYALSSNWVGLERFMNQFPLIFINIIGMLVYGVIVGIYIPWVLLLMAVMSVIYILINFGVEKYANKHKQEINDVANVRQRWQSEAKDPKSGKDIRLYNGKEFIIKIMKFLTQKQIIKNRKLINFEYYGHLSNNIFTILRDLLAYILLTYKVVNNEIDIATFIFLLGLVTGFSAWVNGFSESFGTSLRCNPEVNDFRKAMNLQNVFNHGESNIDIKKLSYPLSIKFDHVSFKYEGADEYTIKDLNFNIKQGEKIALVGNNGAGKSTIVKLLTGLYKPTEGRILIDDIDICDFNIEDYYSLLSVVFQDSEPLAFTVKDNVSCQLKEDVNEEKYASALKKSGIASKISKLPLKDDTFISQMFDLNGIKLSGGETQKLMLARAIYKNAPLLVLDEPTAALDPISESKMYEKYNDITKGNTSVFISHRLASTRFCDRIFFLENGKIIEEGTHDSLLALNGKYSEMFNIQAQYYKEGDDNE